MTSKQFADAILIRRAIEQFTRDIQAWENAIIPAKLNSVPICMVQTTPNEGSIGAAYRNDILMVPNELFESVRQQSIEALKKELQIWQTKFKDL